MREYQTSPSTQMACSAYVDIDLIDKFTEYDRMGADRIMDDPEFEHLVEHVREHGILHPLGLEWSTKDNYAYLGEGHHRLLAAKRLGMTEVPVMICRRSGQIMGRAGAHYVGPYTGPDRDVWDEPRAPDIFSPADVGIEIVRPAVEVEVNMDAPSDGWSL